MKVLLIELPLSMKELGGSLEKVASRLPSLGVGYIASVLEQNNFTVKILDAGVLNLNEEEIIKEILLENPKLIGITATVLTIEKAQQISKKIKEILPNTILVLGGAHVTSMPKDCLKNSYYDVGVIGEGEYTFLEIAKMIKNRNLNLKLIKGIAYKKEDNIIINERREFIQNLDELPFPARHLFPLLSEYHPTDSSYKKLPLAHLITSRGCPYQCIFCDRSVFGNNVRMRSAKNVVDEIEYLIKNFSVKEIKFLDDTFTLNRQRVVDILKEMKRRNIIIYWSCMTRVDRVDKELLKQMKESGCWQIIFGLESGDERILKVIKKGITLEQARNAVKWAKESKLETRAFFIIGLPQETEETIKNTIKFSKELPLDAVTFCSVSLYPGNELYELCKKEGKILHTDFSNYQIFLDLEKTKLSYIPEGLKEEYIKHQISKAYKEFYFRPKYILNKIFAIRSFEDIARYMRAFKSIVSMVI